MKIVKFLDKTWKEIPEKNNPAMLYFEGNGGVGPEECIMIFKGEYPLITGGGFVVAEVTLGEDITKLGVFWRPELASLFADSLLMTQGMVDCWLSGES